MRVEATSRTTHFGSDDARGVDTMSLPIPRKGRGERNVLPVGLFSQLNREPEILHNAGPRDQESVDERAPIAPPAVRPVS